MNSIFCCNSQFSSEQRVAGSEGFPDMLDTIYSLLYSNWGFGIRYNPATKNQTLRVASSEQRVVRDFPIYSILSTRYYYWQGGFDIVSTGLIIAVKNPAKYNSSENRAASSEAFDFSSVLTTHYSLLKNGGKNE